MGLFNDIVTIGTGGVYSPDNGFSAPGLGIYQNTSLGKKASSSIGVDAGDLFGKKGQEKANAENLAEAQRNRDWQERMSSTAYQRAMADMKEAGLNPMLAYMQGGASTPSGAQGTVQNANPNLVDAASKAITGIGGVANQAAAVQQQGQMNESTIKLNSTTAIQATANAKKLNAEADRIRANLPKDKAKSKLYDKADKLYDEAEALFKNSAQPQKTLTDRLYEQKALNDKNLKDAPSRRDRDYNRLNSTRVPKFP